MTILCDDSAMRVVVNQFEGIDATPALPLAAGCLVATARSDASLVAVRFSIAFQRQAIADVVAGYDRPLDSLTSRI